MCGIAGFVEFRKDSLSRGNPFDRISSMLKTVEHRGPDDMGICLYGYSMDISKDNVRVYPESRHQIALGHNRLSIIDLSQKGHQPMRNGNGSIEIIFNGEIYNYIELKQKLSSVMNFYTDSDTEVLLAMYEKYGSDMLNMIDGMFSFAILDKRDNKLLCARDVMGIKPFYYHLRTDFFVFGSEPSTVLKGLNITGSVNKAKISEFLLTAVSDHDEGTSYNEVKQLRGGNLLELDLEKGSSKSRKYYNFKLNPIESNDYSAGLYDMMKQSVSRQLRADVQVGTSLSGGIDSGTIVTLAGEILGGTSSNYSTLTFSFPGFDNDESENAKIIADNAGMRWLPVIPDTKTLKTDLERMMMRIGEPFTTLSMFAQYKVMEKARENGIKVMLDGQGGDEVYLGYPRLAQRVMKEYLFKGNIPGFLKEWTGLKKNATVSYVNSLLGNFFFTSPEAIIKINKKRLKPFVSKDLLNSFDNDFLNSLSFSGNIVEDQLAEMNKYILPKLLKYADRNSMAFSVESRVPHLSVPLTEYALNMPLNWKIRNGWTKYAVRKAMSGRMPDNIIWNRKKLGFDIPQKFWVELLKDDITIWLNEGSMNELINVDQVTKAMESGDAGKPFLWRVISTGCWIRLMNVKIG